MGNESSPPPLTLFYLQRSIYSSRMRTARGLTVSGGGVCLLMTGGGGLPREGVCLLGGGAVECALLGDLSTEGVCLSTTLWQYRHPPSCGQTNTCESITYTILCMRAVIRTLSHEFGRGGGVGGGTNMFSIFANGMKRSQSYE